MVRVFRDKQSSEFVIQTTCLTVETFTSDLSEALAEVLKKSNGDAALDALGILGNAMPIAFKLAGYKADEVDEQRTLVCGKASPHKSDLLVTAGR